MHLFRRAAPRLLILSALLFFAGAAHAQSDEEDLFSRLFGESLPEEKPEDLLFLVAIKVEAPSSFTEPYLLSYAKELQAGALYARAELEGRIAAVDDRLRLSGMFYSSHASYRNLDEEPGAGEAIRVEALLTVSEGFHWGFNFSPWDLYLSYANFAAAGKQAALKIGLNTQEIVWVDPAIDNGLFYYSAILHHSAKLSGGEVDPRHLERILRAEAEIGIKPTDNIALGLGLGYFGLSSPDSYFLYPDYAPPPQAGLEELGLSAARTDYAEGYLSLRLFDYSYKKEGGLRGRMSVSARAYAPIPGSVAPLLRLNLDGNLRFDVPLSFSLVLYERIEALPWALSSASVPAPFRADLQECRSPSGLSSGEFSSLTRASLKYRFAKRLDLGFTNLSFIPQAYYEIAFAHRASYSDRMTGRQGCGLLLEFAFAAPVNLTFGLGLGLGLPGLPGFIPALASRAKPSLNFVFEVR